MLAFIALGGAPRQPLALANPGPPAVAPASQDALLDAVVFSTVQDASAPVAGLAVEVVQRGQVLLRRGYGFADVEGPLPISVDAVFRIGSVTKQFTAAAIMRLVHGKRLALADPVGRYVGGLPPAMAALTVRQLLNQTTGLANYTELPWFQKNEGRPVTAPQLLEQVGAQPLAFPPGTRFAYSNTNFYLLGLVVEKVAGRPYADVVRAELVASAGLSATAMCPDAAADRKDPRGYRHDGRVLAPAKPLSMTAPFAAGGLCSTVDDLVTWTRALAAGRVVGSAEYAAMTEPATLADGKRSGYGFGLFVDQMAGHRRIHHGGAINGFSSELAYLPDDDLTIVVLANTEGDVPVALADRLAHAALGVAEPPTVNLPLSADQAAPFVGRYSIPALGQTLAVQFRQGELQLGRADRPGPRMRLSAQGGGVFAAPNIRAVLHFHVSGGHATTITVEQMGQTFEATRLPDGS